MFLELHTPLPQKKRVKKKVKNGDGTQDDYRILVSRGENRPQSDLYAFNLQDAIPSFSLLLRADDREPLIDLQSLLTGIYDRASYDLVIDYSQELASQLSEENRV
ncbi:DUF4058 family protein [Nostoc sp. MG11]|uniref:DUF4058 family protein n=1 Tax=Nostoc sp. MG11 TaxID=2721166 RepID=UPI0018695067|nr:DUF4058 family protein [Nostoc sp. MG11]